mgnify:CR=1 FL=1
MFVLGTSLIPNKGNHTQKIPPITSVKDNNVSSAACIAFDPIEYNINPTITDPIVDNADASKVYQMHVHSSLSFKNKFDVI